MNAQWSRECVPDDRAEAGAVGRSGHLGHVDADRAAEETGRGAHHEAAEVQEDSVRSGSLCENMSVCVCVCVCKCVCLLSIFCPKIFPPF